MDVQYPPHFLLDDHEESFETEVFTDEDGEMEDTKSFFRSGKQGDEFTQAVSSCHFYHDHFSKFLMVLFRISF